MPARQEPHDFFPCNLREATPTSLGIGAFSPSPASTHLMSAMTGRASAPTLSFPKWFLKSGAHVCPANLYLAPRVISTPIIVLLPHSLRFRFASGLPGGPLAPGLLMCRVNEFRGCLVSGCYYFNTCLHLRCHTRVCALVHLDRPFSDRGEYAERSARI